MIADPVADGDAAGLPDVSIIVVNWNTREMTLDALRSVRKATHEARFELIVVDNGSHDGSAEAIVREFPEARLLAEPVNHGFARANNIAARHARAPLLLLLNSDTLVLDGAIDRLLAFARRRPEARIWGGRTLFADGSLNIGSAWGRLSGASALFYATGLSSLLRRWIRFDPEAMRAWDRSDERAVAIVSGCFFLVERSLWEDLGGFDPAFFMYAEEADFCMRAMRHGASPKVTPEATIVHFGGGSATARAQTRVSLFRGKIGLAQRHLSAREAAVVRASYAFAAASRAALFAVGGALSPRQRAAARTWREVWQRRAEWLGGVASGTLEDRE